MVLPLWGSLQKAQDNPQTIEEAIAEAIAAHEADPDSHMGPGESIEQHKSETVIDHPPGSLLPDKVSFNDLQFDTTFPSLDAFTVSAGVSAGNWPGVGFDIFDGGGDLRTLKANMTGILTGSTVTYDIQFDLYFQTDSADNKEIINIGITNNAMTTRHLGVRITGGKVYGFARWGGTEHLTGSLLTLADVDIAFVRVFYDYAGGVINFYADGALAATLTPASAVSLSNQFSVYCEDNAAEGTIFKLYRLNFSRSL